MPCNSYHMKASNRELEESKLLCVYDAVFRGDKIEKDHWQGYHPQTYCKSGLPKEEADRMTKALCDLFKAGDFDFESVDKRVNIWWLEHQIHDSEKE